MYIIIKLLIILIVLLFFIFNNEIIKLTLKYYKMKYYINKDKCFVIMCEIDDICKKHGIKYYFSEGTALGLYRDGDLIKWDDETIGINWPSEVLLLSLKDEVAQSIKEAICFN